MQECKVVFLDRDGVINKRPPMHEYVKNRKELIILSGVDNAIRRLNEAGFFVYVVSNQRGVQRGHMTLEDLQDVHNYLNECIGKNKAHIDGFYICPHGENECECRKPKPGLLYNCEKDLEAKGYIINKEQSALIGDSDTDIQAGRAYGVKSLKIGNEKGEYLSLKEAVTILLNSVEEP